MKRLQMLVVVIAMLATQAGADWANWRGPERTGVGRDKDLPDKWDLKTGENLIWKNNYGSRSTPIVLNNRVYIINDAGEGITEQERVMCFNADTGEKVWEHRFNVFLTDIVSDRVGWTNLAGDPETGNVYAHGVQGLFICFNKDGKVLWSRSLTEEYGRISGYGGRVVSPVIDGDLVILGLVNASWGEQARGGSRFVAFNKRDGNVVWWGDTQGRVKDTYYSTPVVTVIGGQRLLITGGADGGVHAFKVRTGEKVWSYLFGSGAVNCSPVVDGSLVFIGHGDENPDSSEQGRVICVDAAKVKDGQPELVWKADGIKVKFASPIIHEGKLYVCDEVAKLYCLDTKSGKKLWKKPFSYGRNSMGSPVLADGKIYVGEVNSKFHILQPAAAKCDRLHAQFFPAPQGSVAEVELNGGPAIANGRIFFCTSTQTICIGKKDHKATTDKIAEPKEDAADGKPSHLQIYPADVSLDPGESIAFKARLFDDHGRFLKEVKAEWQLAPMVPPPPLPNTPPPKTPPAPPPVLKGELTLDGKLTVDKAMNGQFGNVIAKTDGLTGRSRVRVAPALPYKQDFEKVPADRSPGGWINAMGKFAVRKVNDTNVLVKLAVNPSPLVARANAYLSKPTLTDYTMEADIMGAQVRQDMPDVGIGANRYTLLLDGNKQRLRLVSWDALPRIDKTISYPWKPDVWYRLKLTVEIKGEKGIARGKAWQRDQPEPKEWTVEVEDPLPNKEGAPALYGYATGILENQPGTEIFYDNVIVTPHGKQEPRGEGGEIRPVKQETVAAEAASVPQDNVVYQSRQPRFPRWHRLRAR